MKKFILKLPLFKKDGPDQKRGPAKVHNGLVWCLYALHYEEDWDGYLLEEEHDELFVICKPKDPNMLFRCEAEITYKTNDGKRHCETFLVNHTTNGDSTNSEDSNFDKGSFEREFIAEVEVKALEIIQRNTFDFKDTVLSDIKLIVGDKTFYCSKQILALHSKKFYEIIYGGDKEVDKIDIVNVRNPILQIFLEILHGFDCDKNILAIIELAKRFESKRCMDHCEDSYNHLNTWDDRKYIGQKLKEAQAHLRNVSGQDGPPNGNMDFNITRDNLTDIVLSVGDKKFNVSKQILANASSYFHSMFCSDSTDTVKEVELKAVDAAGYEEFLQHVYYPRRYVKESTLESLLSLSNYYDVKLIRQNCIRFILFDMKATIARKMVLAVKHNLDDLFKNLAARIETVEDFTAFSKLAGFDELDEKTIARIKPVEKNSLKRKLEAGPSNT